MSAGRYEVVARNGLGEEAEGSLTVETQEDPALLIVGIAGVAAVVILVAVVLDRRRRAAAR